jgi:hypothetical protein
VEHLRQLVRQQVVVVVAEQALVDYKVLHQVLLMAVLDILGP